MPEAIDVAIVVATFLLAGAVKGIIGLGLPTVSLGILTAAFDLTTAMALLLVPSFATNVWQALAGAHATAVLRRTWPFLATAFVTVWLGTLVLVRVDGAWLAALLGLLLIAYGASSLAGARCTIQPGHERWAGPLFGAANGVLTGMTGSFVVPGVMYLQALGLTRDALIQAMGLLFTASTVALALALGSSRLISASHGLQSALAVLPALLGMVAGQTLRRKLDEVLFRRVFFASLLLLGGYIALQASTRI